ncbi:unnamed protein product [Prunus armeniaca]
MKEAGYIPETRFVLHDIDQEGKEDALLPLAGNSSCEMLRDSTISKGEGEGERERGGRVGRERQKVGLRGRKRVGRVRMQGAARAQGAVQLRSKLLLLLGLSSSSWRASKGASSSYPRGLQWSPLPTFQHSKGSSDPSCPNVDPPLIEDMAFVYGIPFVASIIQDLPMKCNEHLSFPISNSMNCTQ